MRKDDTPNWQKLQQQIHYFSAELCHRMGSVASRFVEEAVLGGHILQRICSVYIFKWSWEIQEHDCIQAAKQYPLQENRY